MKILIDAHVFDGKFQGSRTYIKGLYAEMILLKKDWDFYFIAQNTKNLEEEFGNYPNVHYLPLKHHNKFIRLFWEIPQLIRKHQIDFSHFQYIAPPIKIGKYIVTTHDILFEEERFRHFFPSKYRLINGTLFKRSAKLADILLTVSEYSKNKISELYKIDKKDIVVTSNAINVNLDHLEKDNYIQEKYKCNKYILYVSRIEPRKNHISILRAYKNLQLYEKGFELVFIGNQDIKDIEYDNFINDNQPVFKNNLHLFSNITETELKKFYTNSEFVVYPSFAEGFGIPPLEGAVYKKPVLCSNATAMAEFTFFNHFIDPYNQKELEETILEIINNQSENLGEIQQTILKKYDWKKPAQVLINSIA